MAKSIEDIKRLAEEMGISESTEMSDDELEMVSGGALPPDWEEMPIEQKRVAILVSCRQRALGQTCFLD